MSTFLFLIEWSTHSPCFNWNEFIISLCRQMCCTVKKKTNSLVGWVLPGRRDLFSNKCKLFSSFSRRRRFSLFVVASRRWYKSLKVLAWKVLALNFCRRSVYLEDTDNSEELCIEGGGCTTSSSHRSNQSFSLWFLIKQLEIILSFSDWLPLFCSSLHCCFSGW